jgi:hypothetical protein
MRLRRLASLMRRSAASPLKQCRGTTLAAKRRLPAGRGAAAGTDGSRQQDWPAGGPRLNRQGIPTQTWSTSWPSRLAEHKGVARTRAQGRAGHSTDDSGHSRSFLPLLDHSDFPVPLHDRESYGVNVRIAELLANGFIEVAPGHEGMAHCFRVDAPVLHEFNFGTGD